MNYAPIALFVYNRPEHTRKTVEALMANDGAMESVLFIYADGPKIENDEKVKAVRDYIATVTGFKEVHLILSDTNRGLADSIISGVTEIVNRFGRVIVMEDDLVTVPFFLKYMNEALEKYEGNPTAYAVTGYSYFREGSKKLPETYFLQNMCSWTWATWKDKWEKFDPEATGWERLMTDRKWAREFDHNGCFGLANMMNNLMVKKTINSWAVRWCFTAFLNGGLALFPNKSLVTNIGQDGSGTNCKSTSRDEIITASEPISFFPDEVVETKKTYREINRYYRRFHLNHYLERAGFYITHPANVIKKIRAPR